MKSFEPIYQDWLDILVKDARESYEKSGLKASGDYGKQLEGTLKMSTFLDNLKLLGAPHSIYMSDGRRPNKVKSRGMIRFMHGKIEQWIKDKGLRFDDTDSAAWAIATKIVKEGITVPNKYNDGKVINSLFTAKRFADLTGQLGEQIVFDMRSDLRTAFQQPGKK